jgi:hypothetical protein
MEEGKIMKDKMKGQVEKREGEEKRRGRNTSSSSSSGGL